MSKDYYKLKENQISQVKELSTFLCLERCKEIESQWEFAVLYEARSSNPV